jgi:pantoate--beta-alanine ligase
MVRDLDLPIEIVGCPTVREPDGLAMSSRNAYLDDARRLQARCLYQALRDAQRRVERGQSDPTVVVEALRRRVAHAGPAQIDSIRVVAPENLQPVERINARVLIALAVRIGTTRLIDNVQVDPPPRRG